MDNDAVTHRRELALMQHERVMQEADFVTVLARQARNRAATAPVYAEPSCHPQAVRVRVGTN